MNPIVIYKELEFVYIVKGRKFIDLNQAEKYRGELYAKQESQNKKIREEEKKRIYQEI